MAVALGDVGFPAQVALVHLRAGDLAAFCFRRHAPQLAQRAFDSLRIGGHENAPGRREAVVETQKPDGPRQRFDGGLVFVRLESDPGQSLGQVGQNPLGGLPVRQEQDHVIHIADVLPDA